MLVLAGCGDPIHPQQVIEKTRVLVGRAEVQGEPERATPEPGETATARWLVVSPAELPELGWTLVACQPSPVATGASQCEDAPFATSRVEPSDAATPELTFGVPDEYRGTTLLVAGIICFGGAPPDVGKMLRQWPRASGCGGGRAQAVTLEVSVQNSDEGANDNPSLSDDRLELDGEEWLAPPEGIAAPCAEGAGGAELPLVSRASHRLEVGYASKGSDQQPTSDGLGESLLVAAFSTSGKLDRTFTVIEWEGKSSARSARLDWAVPKKASVDGDLVRFYFVTRDNRGGADWTERAACVVP